MKSISYTSARGDLAKTMQEVRESRAPIAITRKGAGSVVMMSMEEYESMEETLYLMRSPESARRLLDAIAELESGGGQECELIE